MRGAVGRRQAVQLAAVVAGGWAVGLLVRRAAPVGRAVTDAPAGAAALAEDGGPAAGPESAGLRLAVFTDYRCPACRHATASSSGAAALAEDGGPAAGPDSAGLRLAVFTDYRCPACRHAAAPLEEAVARDGDVRLLYRDWPIFGPPSERAARVALAAMGQGLYRDVHCRLMAERRPLDDEVLRAVAVAAGADWARIEADLDVDARAIDARLAANARHARALGLPGTPAYLAAARLTVGALDAAGFTRLFAEARER